MGNSLGTQLACIADLDDGDLGLIFRFLGRQHGPTVTLVCHKWHDVFWAEPALWHSIRLARPGRASAAEEAAGAAWQLQVLRRAARHVQAAEISAVYHGPQPAGAATWHTAALLLELQPGTLHALTLRHVATSANAPICLPEAALEALPRFAVGLTRLELASSRPAARPAAAALTQLRQLCQLSLHMGAVTGEALQAAAQLPALTRLELGSPPAELPTRMPELLGSLTQLRQLACLGCGVLPGGTVAVLAELPQLEALALAMSLPRGELPQLARLPALRRLELCERRWGTGSLELPPPAAFPALQRYRFWHEAEGGCFVVAGAQLRSCAYADCTLQVGELRPPLASLQALAEALLPGGVRAAPALAGLVLREAALSAEAVLACPLLEGLRLLHLRGCWAAPAGEQPAAPLQPSAWTEQQCGDLLPAVQLLLGQVPALEQLTLSHCRLGLPGSGGHGEARLDVGGNLRLRRLALHSSNAHTTARLLPATYPQGLEEADLEEAVPPTYWPPGSPPPPAPAALPPGLAACTALRRLRLRGLWLPQGLPAHMLPGLIELEICRGGLERLPPGLSAATALARLTLDSNNRLALSHSDAEVLRRLPRLQALQAQYTATPSRVAVHLRLLAPQLEAVWSLGQVFHRQAQPSDRQWRVLVLGLDAAGVTTAMQRLAVLGPSQTSVPCIGFVLESIERGNVALFGITINQSMGNSFWTLLRWYLQSSGGLVYVVDSCDTDRLGEFRRELARLLRWEDAVHGLPLLLLANKQDLPASLEPEDLAQRLGVATLCQQRRWRAQGSSTLSGEGLLEGFSWLAGSMAGVD